MQLLQQRLQPLSLRCLLLPCLCSTGHVPDPCGLLATVMHVNDFDDEYLPLARIDDNMLLCLYTAAANA
eukprot:4203987-Pleurochrysis_carterae.AAC.1